MAVSDVKDKVQRILAEALGSVSIDKDGDFHVRTGSSVVFVNVYAINDTTTMIKVFSILLRGVALTPELYRWVATEGQNYRFGHCLVTEGEGGVGSVILDHTLLGDFLDAEELKWAVFAMGSTADEIDDVLKTRFGGQRFIEE